MSGNSERPEALAQSVNREEGWAACWRSSRAPIPGDYSVRDGKMLEGREQGVSWSN